MTALRNQVAVLGAGGHAKVVIATLRAVGFGVSELYDDDPVRVGATVLGARVMGPIRDCPDTPETCAVIAIGNNIARSQVAARFHHLIFVTAVHPSAVVHQTVQLGPGTVVFAGAVIQPDTRVGSHGIINTGASVDHDCLLGDFVHVAPGARLGGGVRVCTGSFLGLSCAVLPNVTIGRWTTVGAGGVVLHDLPDQVTAVGVPVRPIIR